MAQRSRLRASDAEREQVAERLRQAAAEGRLSTDELEQRLSTALSAITRAELGATVRDLPVAGARRSRGRSAHAVTIARAHPMLLVIAIPIALVAVAVTIAIAIVWSMFVLIAALLFGHRRYLLRHSRPRHPRII